MLRVNSALVLVALSLFPYLCWFKNLCCPYPFLHHADELGVESRGCGSGIGRYIRLAGHGHDCCGCFDFKTLPNFRGWDNYERNLCCVLDS